MIFPNTNFDDLKVGGLWTRPSWPLNGDDNS
jgi:hypothetical protein